MYTDCRVSVRLQKYERVQRSISPGPSACAVAYRTRNKILKFSTAQQCEQCRKVDVRSTHYCDGLARARTLANYFVVYC